MDFLKNTKNGRVLPWSPALDKLPFMEPCDVAEAPVEPVGAVVVELGDLTRAELIEKAKAEGLPAKATMKREELLALFAPAEGDDL